MARNFSVPGVGDTIAGRYQIEEQIGQGGFGIVFKATQIGMQREVAIKTLLPSAMVREDIVERFRREAMLARNLNHPNTIRLYDFGQTDGGLLYIAMEFLAGRTLSQVIKEDGPLEPARVQRISSQVLKSLAEAHQHGIIHRDLKPANIMLQDVAGEPDFVKVLDFGIAKALDSRGDEDDKLTKTGMGFGTAFYMSPEQIRGKGICAATDLYALGLVMVEMMTGETVFDGESSMDIAIRQLANEPVPIPDWVLRGPLGPLIQRATQKQAKLRYPSAVEMLRDLRSVDPRASIDVSAQIMTVRMDAIRPGTPNPYQSGQLSLDSGQVQASGGGGKLVMALSVAFGILLITALVIGGLAWTRFGGSEPAPVATADAGTKADAGATPPPAPDQGQEEPARMVQASVISTPEGAEIFRDGEYLGITPAKVPLPRDVGVANLVLKLGGFTDAPLEVRLDRDGTYEIELEAAGVKEGPGEGAVAQDSKPPADKGGEPVGGDSKKPADKGGGAASAGGDKPEVAQKPAGDKQPAGNKPPVDSKPPAEGGKKPAGGGKKPAGDSKPAETILIPRL